MKRLNKAGLNFSDLHHAQTEGGLDSRVKRSESEETCDQDTNCINKSSQGGQESETARSERNKQSSHDTRVSNNLQEENQQQSVDEIIMRMSQIESGKK